MENQPGRDDEVLNPIDLGQTMNKRDMKPKPIDRSSFALRPVKTCKAKGAIFFCALALIASTNDALAGQWIEGRVTHVRDVDTIEVQNLPVRLNGVDGPELDEKGGRDGKRWMQKLVLHKPVKCWLNGDKTYDRWVGTCYEASGEDIGALAIGAGMARDCPRFSGGKYRQYETAASRKLPFHSYCR